jgi:hypothetical protein
MARLVVFFLVHPGARLHLRELMRHTGLPSASIQAELRRLTGLGALRREDERGHTFYAANEAHVAWRAWILLLRACARPADVLREALVDASGIDGAFVFGSVARTSTWLGMRTRSFARAFAPATRSSSACSKGRRSGCAATMESSTRW